MKAIILFSGGLDSTVMLALALSQERECLALSFDYGQRHKVELEAAKLIADHYGVKHRILTIDPQTFQHSSLVSSMPVPTNRTPGEMQSMGTPNTYVPARNTLFLSFALSQAEIEEAQEIYFGANALDINPYPDCRPAFIEAFQALINVSTKQAIEKRAPQLITPLIGWNKKEIVECGKRLKVPMHLTSSCYQPLRLHVGCGCCDACILRNEALTNL